MIENVRISSEINLNLCGESWTLWPSKLIKRSKGKVQARFVGRALSRKLRKKEKLKSYDFFRRAETSTQSHKIHKVRIAKVKCHKVEKNPKLVLWKLRKERRGKLKKIHPTNTHAERNWENSKVQKKDGKLIFLFLFAITIHHTTAANTWFEINNQFFFVPTTTFIVRLIVLLDIKWAFFRGVVEVTELWWNILAEFLRLKRWVFFPHTENYFLSKTFPSPSSINIQLFS